jgi:hypothetical protein
VDDGDRSSCCLLARAGPYPQHITVVLPWQATFSSCLLDE